jgi:hypothetical protein
MRSFKLEPRGSTPDPQVKYVILVIVLICAIDAARLHQYFLASIIVLGLPLKVIQLARNGNAIRTYSNWLYIVSVAAACYFEFWKIIST